MSTGRCFGHIWAMEGEPSDAVVRGMGPLGLPFGYHLGRWEITAPIAAGTWGCVYEARRVKPPSVSGTLPWIAPASSSRSASCVGLNAYYLGDTSALARAKRPEVAARLDPLLVSGLVARCTPTDLEPGSPPQVRRHIGQCAKPARRHHSSQWTSGYWIEP
jgi:hypothetical protein